MKHPFFAFFLLAFFVLAGCQDDVLSNIQLLPVKCVAFNLPSAAKPWNMGCLRNDAGQDVFYFVHVKTAKQVSFCDASGKLISVIPLRKAINALGPLNAVLVLSQHSAIAFSTYTNLFCRVNDSGNITMPIELSVWRDKEQYAIYTTKFQYNEKDSTILVLKMIEDGDLLEEAYATGDYEKVWKHQSRFGIGAIVKFQGDSTTVSDLLQNLQFRYRNPGQEGDDHISATYASDGRYVYYHSGYRDSIYKVAIATNEVSLVIKPESEYGSIGEERPTGVGKESPILYATQRVPLHFIYDKYRNLLLFCVPLRMPNSTGEYESGDYRAWSMLIYDTALHKQGEVLFEKCTYNCKPAFISEEGIWIEVMTDKKEHTDQFQLFRIVCKQ